MGIFGWSYPPGCNGTPFDEDYPCEVCGLFEDKCVCPECPECGDIGNSNCYKPKEENGCGLVMSEEQKISLKKQEDEWARKAADEAEFWAERAKAAREEEQY